MINYRAGAGLSDNFGGDAVIIEQYMINKAALEDELKILNQALEYCEENKVLLGKEVKLKTEMYNLLYEKKRKKK